MKQGLTSGLVLLILGIICGLTLSVVNFLTAPIIMQNEQAKKYESLNDLGIEMSQYTITDSSLSGAIDTVYLLTPIDSQTNPIIRVYSVTTTGFSEGLNMMIAVDENMIVVAYVTVSHQESPGYGKDTLETHDFNMVGAVLPDTTQFEAKAKTTVTCDAVLLCFDLVAIQATLDFGGEN
ncbi:MAG: FMN-binding protein [Candidatus Izemoplasmatales bacterium]|nr:hypothetical protein [Candidatus Izemoplasmatales bacterium]MDD3865029.1 hypothetical protein [Candidatus Izemoplasmatales bacterium]